MLFRSPLNACTTRSGRGRRELLREAKAIFPYVLRTAPADISARRYVRAIECLRAGEPLELPRIFLSAPSLLALLDRANGSNENFFYDLNWRLDAAIALSEASTQCVERFLNVDQSSGRLRGAAIIAKALFSESLRRTARLIFRPLIFRFKRARSDR